MKVIVKNDMALAPSGINGTADKIRDPLTSCHVTHGERSQKHGSDSRWNIQKWGIDL
jgi:hypothetical protein